MSAVTATRDWMRPRVAVPVNALGTIDTPAEQVVITRAGGPADPIVVGLEHATLLFTIWGGDSLDALNQLAQQITDDLQAVGREAFTATTVCFGFTDVTTIDAPERDASRPRQLLTAAGTFLHRQGD